MKQMNRAEFIAMADPSVPDDDNNAKEPVNKFANKAAPHFGEKSLSGIDEYTGQFGTPQLAHLLRRTLFGVTQADINYFSSMSLDDVVAALLTLAATPSPPVNVYNDSSFTDPDVPAGQTWINAPAGSVNVESRRRKSLKEWWLGLMLNQDRTITEKMTLFWHDHFAIQMSTVADGRYCYKYHAMMRANALGNFKALARLVTTDPAMLIYLNGDTNTKDNPNENYGRELQELFTVGKGPDSLYTQSDVETAAKVLTGWSDNKIDVTTSFNSDDHDTSDKQFSAFYNNTIITGQTGANGANETDQLIDMIFSQVEAAKFLCRNLYRWFIYYNIDDDTETNVITPLANVLVQNNFDMLPVLSTLLKSSCFFDPANMGCFIKTPADHLVGMCRQFNVVFPDSSDLPTQYKAWSVVYFGMAALSMDIGDPPNVAGWPAYYQAPAFHELWINSDTLPARNQYTDAISSVSGIHQSGFTLKIDFLAFAQQLSNPGDPNQLISDSAVLLSANTYDITEMTFLKSILLSGLSSDSYWTDAWHLYISDPTNVTNKNVVLTRLRSLYSYMMDMAEYQLI